MNYFTGYIDEVAYYDATLSADDVEYIYSQYNP